MNLGGVAALGVDDGTFDLAIGLGLDRISEKIYFPELMSVDQSLRDKASWQNIGVLDVVLLLSFEVGDAGKWLGRRSGNISKLYTDRIHLQR